MKRIKYICYYDQINTNRKRSGAVSAINKLNYIFDTLNSLGFGVDIISMSLNEKNEFKYERGILEKFGPNTLKLFGSFGGKAIPIIRVFDRWIVKSKLFFYLLKNVKADESIIVYHSAGYTNLILWAQKIRGFKIIGEIEEIYQDVKHMSAHSKRSEFRFFTACDKYIFPTELLNDKLNPLNKPFVVVYGTYKIEPSYSEPLNDGKIHVVYAGTFDPLKGGVTAVDAAEYLPENYHVHICGFGSAEDTKSIKKYVEDISKTSKAQITFDGLKKGEDYIKFIQKCHIGLSTQDPAAAFNATSFPSKILSYMANGLSVVSIDIPAIRNSAIGDSICYYSEQTPQKIAEAVLSLGYKKEPAVRNIIRGLHLRFKKDINMLISE